MNAIHRRQFLLRRKWLPVSHFIPKQADLHSVWSFPYSEPRAVAKDGAFFLICIIVLALGSDWMTHSLKMTTGLWLSGSLLSGSLMSDDKVAKPMFGALLSLSLRLWHSVAIILQRGNPSWYSVIMKHLAQAWHCSFHACFRHRQGSMNYITWCPAKDRPPT